MRTCSAGGTPPASTHGVAPSSDPNSNILRRRFMIQAVQQIGKKSGRCVCAGPMSCGHAQAPKSRAMTNDYFLTSPASVVFGNSPFLLAAAISARLALRSAERVACVPDAAEAAGVAEASLVLGRSPFLTAAAVSARLALRSAERVAWVPDAGVAA